MTLPLVFIFHQAIHHTGRWERTPLHQMAFLTAILKLKDSDVDTDLFCFSYRTKFQNSVILSR